MAARDHGRRANVQSSVTQTRVRVAGDRIHGCAARVPLAPQRMSMVATPHCAAHAGNTARLIRSCTTARSAYARSDGSGCASAITHCTASATNIPAQLGQRRGSSTGAFPNCSGTQAYLGTAGTGQSARKRGPLYQGAYSRPICTPICSFKSKT